MAVTGSLIESASVKSSAAHEPPPKKALYGLYSVYICIGIVYGFFAANISGPLICHYYFGPFGQPGGTDAALCLLGVSLFNFPWSLKVFIALVVDNFKLFGSRKRWWILAAWVGALGLLAVASILVPSFKNSEDHHKTYGSYVLIMTGMNALIALADVAADGMGVAYTKLEPEDKRGGVIATNYQCRFVATMMSGGVIKFFFMNGPQFVDPTNPESEPLFKHFGFELQYVQWLLFALTLPFLACMFLWLEDPPLDKADEHSSGCKGVSETICVMWKSTQSYAVFNLVIFAIGIQSVGSMVSPADQAVSDIASPDGTQLSMGTIGVYAAMMCGIQLYKRYFLNGNQRMVATWCYSVSALLQLAELAIILNGVNMAPSFSGWFYVIQSDLPQLTQAIAFCLVQIAVAEIAPVGMEASTYEFILTASNIAITVGSIFTSLAMDWLNLASLSGEEYKQAYQTDIHQYHIYQKNMLIGALCTAAASTAAAILFSLCLPSGPQQCREWAGIKSWQVPSVSTMNFGVLGFMIVWSLEKVLLKMMGWSPAWSGPLNNVLALMLSVYALGGLGHRVFTIATGRSP